MYGTLLLSIKLPKFATQLESLAATNMTTPIASAATQSVATITFGILATLIGVLALWQAPRAFRRLYGQLSERQAESDLESRD